MLTCAFRALEILLLLVEQIFGECDKIEPQQKCG